MSTTRPCWPARSRRKHRIADPAGASRLIAAAAADGLDQRADLLTRTIQRAFESDLPILDTKLHDVAAAATALLTALIDADHAEPGLHRNAN